MDTIMDVIKLPFWPISAMLGAINTGITYIFHLFMRNGIVLTMVSILFYLTSRALRPLHQSGVLVLDHNDVANWIITALWFLVTAFYVASYYLSPFVLAVGWILGLVFPNDYSRHVFGRYGRSDPYSAPQRPKWDEVLRLYYGNRLWGDVRDLCMGEAEAEQVLGLLLLQGEPVLVCCLTTKHYLTEKVNEARVRLHSRNQN